MSEKLRRKEAPVSMSTTPWTDRTMDYILEATEYRSRAALLTPAVLSLLVNVISSLERDRAEGRDVDLKLLARGQDLVREYARRDPASLRVAHV